MAINAIKKGELPTQMDMLEKAKVFTKRLVDPGSNTLLDIDVLVAMSSQYIQDRYKILLQKKCMQQTKNASDAQQCMRQKPKMTDEEIYNEFKKTYDEYAAQKQKNDLKRLHEKDIFGRYKRTLLTNDNIETLDPNNMNIMAPPASFRVAVKGGMKKRNKTKRMKRKTVKSRRLRK
jgi:hypothetical protein